MNPVMFRLELEDPEQAEEVAALVEQRFAALEDIDQVQAEPEELRDLATAITVVAAAVMFAKGGTELVVQARRFIAELKGLLGDVQGLGRAVVLVGVEEVDVDELSDAQVADIASG